MRVALVPLLLVLVGCGPVTRSYVTNTSGRRPASRMVVFIDSGDPKQTRGLNSVALELGNELRRRGFQVKRFAKEDGSTPYGLELRGEFAPCAFAGYDFAWIDITVIDMVKNEQILVVSGQGYTEGCWRGSKEGTLYADLANRLAEAWEETTAGSEPKPTPADSL